eukprot:4585167-Pleurochrysis_carterae.AAC.1
MLTSVSEWSNGMTLLTSARSCLARFEEEKKLFKAQEMRKSSRRNSTKLSQAAQRRSSRVASKMERVSASPIAR